MEQDPTLKDVLPDALKDEILFDLNVEIQPDNAGLEVVGGQTKGN